LYGQGLRAFIPKAELVKRATSFTELKEYVSCSLGTFLQDMKKKTFFLFGWLLPIFLFYYLLFGRAVDNNMYSFTNDTIANIIMGSYCEK